MRKLVCPVKEKNHFIKLKELINLKLQISEVGDKFACFICKKDFSYQKIVALRKCGHVLCRKCLESVCIKDEVCAFCNSQYFPSDIISLQETGTGFSEHNLVQTNKLNPYFKY